MQREYRDALAALGGLVLMVLIIACVNVANLMTAQASARAREMALRVSIGAGRWRLMRMVLVQSALLAFLAAASGALFAWWSAPFVVSMINPPDNPARLILPADWRVLGFGVALSLVVVLLFGLLPALRASSVRPVSVLKGGDDPHSQHRLMHGMIALQVAFCFLVLFVAGLFVIYLSTSFQQTDWVFNGPNPLVGNHKPARAVIAVLGSCGGLSARSAGRRARVTSRISFVGGFKLEWLHLHQRRATERQSCLLPARSRRGGSRR